MFYKSIIWLYKNSLTPLYRWHGLNTIDFVLFKYQLKHIFFKLVHTCIDTWISRSLCFHFELCSQKDESFPDLPKRDTKLWGSFLSGCTPPRDVREKRLMKIRTQGKRLHLTLTVHLNLKPRPHFKLSLQTYSQRTPRRFNVIFYGRRPDYLGPAPVWSHAYVPVLHELLPKSPVLFYQSESQNSAHCRSMCRK